ncbi:MAG: hypothetical protein QXH93_05885, partial [Conexivisphaerales archaeon]
DFNAIKEYWIDKQLYYFSKASAKNKNRADLLRRISFILFIIGLCSAAVATIAAFLFYAGISNSNLKLIISLSVLSLISFSNLKLIISLSVFSLISFPSIAGLIEVYIDRSRMEDTAEEYFRMKEIFERANDAWEKSNANKCSIILELAKEALRENADWHLLQIHTSEDIPIV